MNEAMKLVQKAMVPCCSRLAKVLAWIALLTAFLIPTLHAQTNCLGRTFTKLRAHQPVTIAYFGGSITAGDGASNPDTTSYRPLTTNWFKTTYPSSTITEINAAIPGTSSQYGCFRCQRDVLSHSPDLVIVEFAVNDINLTDFEIDRQMEGIIRQVMASNPNAEILYLYTCNETMGATYTSGSTPHTVTDDQTLATAYGIGSVNMGYNLWQTISTSNGAYVWQSGDGEGNGSPLTVDGVHPNDAGYQIYFNAIKTFLTAHQNDTTEAGYVAQSGLSTNPILGQTIDTTTALPIPSGWTVQPISYFSQPNILFNSTVGAQYSYTFTGTDIGISVMWEASGANLDFSLDGSSFQATWTMSDGPGTASRENIISFGENLPNSAHTLILQIEAAGGLATGTSMYLGSMLVYGTTGSGGGSGTTGQTVVNDTDPGISYQANQWGYSSGRGYGDYQNDVHYAGGNGAYASYTFTGTGIAYVTETNSDEGHVNVQIDGGTAFQVQCSTTSRVAQENAYSIQGLTYGSHTIKITKVDGTVMLLDAFIVYNLPTLVNDNSSSITYQANQFGYSTGRGYNDYQNDVHYAGGNGAYATYTFTGVGIDYITETNSDEGHVNVSIDGGTATEVNCYSVNRTGSNVVYSITGLTNASHTIKITKVDGNEMLLDAFAVITQPVTPTYVNDTDTSIVYTGSWAYSSGRGYGDYDNDCHVCGNNGCTASLTWTGTAITYLTETYSDEGHVNVSIDGGAATEVNCNTSTRGAQVPIFSKTGLASGSHTITITKVDGTFMLLDAFIKQ